MSGIAEVQSDATLKPSKLELLAQWLPDQSWFVGDATDLKQVDRFRFVDPDGEVGLDSMLIASAGQVYYVPVTWRAEPLEDGELIGTLEHSGLGTRYCYNATTDPVFMAELIRVIREGDVNSDIAPLGGEPFPRTMEVAGSGIVAMVDLHGTIRLERVLDGNPDTVAARGLLVATWNHEGVQREDVLAVLR